MHSLKVKEGDEVVVSTTSPGDLEGSLYRIKPKNIVALKSLSGIKGYDKFLNINDSNLFSKIERDSTNSLVEIAEGKRGIIEGYNSSLIGAIINQLDDNAAVPNRVRLTQASRIRGLAGNVRTRDVMIPEFMRDLEVFVPVFSFSNTVIEKNATLVFDRDTTHYTTQNFYMHEGSRVIQKSRKLTMVVLGEMEGKSE